MVHYYAIRSSNTSQQGTVVSMHAKQVLLSRYDHWQPPPNVAVSPDGKSIVLSGMSGRVEAGKENDLFVVHF